MRLCRKCVTPTTAANAATAAIGAYALFTGVDGFNLWAAGDGEWSHHTQPGTLDAAPSVEGVPREISNC